MILFYRAKNILGYFMIMLLLISMGTYPRTTRLDQDFLNQIEALKWTDSDRAISILKKKMLKVENLDDLTTQAWIAIEISKVYSTKRDCDSIKLWYQKAQKIFNQLDDSIGKGEVLFQEGYWQYCQGNYEQALKLTLEGLGIMEANGDKRGVALGYLRLTRIYHFNYKMQNSADTGIIAGKKFEEIGDYINAADSWSFAGHGFRVLGKLDEALNAFNKTLSLAEQSGVQDILGMALNSLAFYFGEREDYDKSEYYFLQSLEYTNPEDERQLMVTNTGLSQIYLYDGQFQKSIRYGNRAMKTIVKINDTFFLSELPEYLAEAYEGLKQYDSAYKYMKMNSKYSDSLFTVSQEKSLEEMRVKYETEKKEEQLASNKKDQFFIIVICVVLLALLIILFLFYRKRQEKNKELLLLNGKLDKKNKQNELLLKEIHHRVKNNLEMVKSLIALQSAQLDDKASKEAMLASQNRVQSMGIIHQKLYQGDNLGSIEMKDYFLNLSEGILDSFNKEEKVKIECAMESLELDIDTAVPIGLIVNELLTNALKYAFPEDNLGNIKISLARKDNNVLTLNVSDNGIGKTTGKAPQGTGFGTQLVQLLTQQLNGKMEEKINNGTTVSFQFKLNTAA